MPFLCNMIPNHAHHVAKTIVLWQPFTIINTEDLHESIIFQIGQQLRCDQEVLPTVCPASCFNEFIMYCALGALVHALDRFWSLVPFTRKSETHLINLIDQREWRSCMLGHAHEV